MKEQLDHRLTQMQEAMAQSNATMYADVFSERGIIFMDNAQMVIGREQIAAQMKNLIDLLGPLQLELRVEEYWETEGEAVQRGHFYHYYPGEQDAFYWGQFIAIWRIQGEQLVLEKFFNFEA